VVAADKAAKGGVVQLNGKMVDRPVVMLAQSVLAQAHMYPCTP
jgi:citrate lyase subunit beta/citryl-CoA lyase